LFWLICKKCGKSMQLTIRRNGKRKAIVVIVSRSRNQILRFSNHQRFHVQRPPSNERKFVSEAVEEKIDHIKHRIMDRDLAVLFENCLPNTLDTTVLSYSPENTPTVDLDTFIITGDIEAMWLRDSTNQVPFSFFSH
jgi:hypothetical protein